MWHRLGLFLAATLTLFPISAHAEAYVIMDRLKSEEPQVLGIAGLYPEGCPADYAGCSNISVRGVIERVGYLDGEDVPNLLRVRDLDTGYIYAVTFPYEEIWKYIGTADSSWIMLWPKVGLQVTIIGIIGGSQGNISLDSIYLSDFLDRSGEFAEEE